MLKYSNKLIKNQMTLKIFKKIKTKIIRSKIKNSKRISPLIKMKNNYLKKFLKIKKGNNKNKFKKIKK